MSATKNISTSWVKHIKDPSKKEEFESYVRNAVSLLERLQEILDEKITEASSSRMSDYDSPSWAYKQADLNGRVTALKEIRKLTEHLQPRGK